MFRFSINFFSLASSSFRNRLRFSSRSATRGSNGRPIKFFHDSFKAATKKIGATGTLPHDMRRSAVRNFRRSGLSEQEGMALSGHQESSIYRRYSIISEEDLIESMKRVEKHLRAEKQNRKVVPINQKSA